MATPAPPCTGDAAAVAAEVTPAATTTMLPGFGTETERGQGLADYYGDQASTLTLSDLRALGQSMVFRVYGRAGDGSTTPITAALMLAPGAVQSIALEQAPAGVLLSWPGGSCWKSL
jgi:hypothetical protein